jgi:pilus assembly protein CpaD
MNTNRVILALGLTLLVGACMPVTGYSEAEAPKHLKLDSATTQFDARFAPGGGALSPSDAVRLRQLASSGAIGPSDRVTVAVAGEPRLAEQRFASISSLLLHYGIVAIPQPVAVSANHALIEVTRTLVTLPPCPNWSKPSASDFGNQPSSNFGCATETNLGMMVANPSDLASGLPAGAAAGQPSAAAVGRYLNDQVVLPAANTALPIAVQSSTAPPAGAGAATGTGTPTGGS